MLHYALAFLAIGLFASLGFGVAPEIAVTWSRATRRRILHNALASYSRRSVPHCR
jgi:hypothetical protein